MHLKGTLRTVFRVLVVITACLHLCGGHYGVLQVVAWSQMIVEYSSERGIVQGAIDTFDGEHPCDLCLSISEAKKEQKEQPVQGSRSSEMALKFLLLPEQISLDRMNPGDPPSLHRLDPELLASLVDSDPAVPPPRSNRA